MYQEFRLICEQCKASHHVGRAFPSQGKRESFYVFTSGDHYEGLNTYLITHEGHQLRMVEMQRPPADYTEISRE